MTERQVRDAIGSLDGKLGDLRREHAWRGIERAISTPAPALAPPRWRVPAMVAAACAVTAVLVYWLTAVPPHDAPAGSSFGSPTELVAAADHQAVFDRNGVTLTLIGPGIASVAERADGLHVRVDRGTVIADRTASAPSVVFSAGTSTTTTRDPRFAVRVEPGMVVFGAGQEARAIVERHVITAAPRIDPPAPEPDAAPVPTPRPAPPPKAEPAQVTERPSAPPEMPVLETSAADLYARAEAALRVRDPEQARTLFQRILDEHGEDPLVDAARYDLALLALERDDRAAARHYADLIIASGRDPNLKVAATKLRDRIAKPKR
jgi:hypothetical protein